MDTVGVWCRWCGMVLEEMTLVRVDLETFAVNVFDGVLESANGSNSENTVTP